MLHVPFLAYKAEVFARLFEEGLRCWLRIEEKTLLGFRCTNGDYGTPLPSNYLATPISVGSLDSSVVHPREVFKEALAASAASVIFVHNHPSGDPSPSEDDIKLTRRLVEVGNIMGVDVLDHIVVADSSYVSLKGMGSI